MVLQQLIYNGDQLFDMDLFIHDVYTLARMFITFDSTTNKIDRGPIECRNKNYLSPKNIIFYGGVMHTDNYAGFINDTFKTTPAIDKQSDTGCIELDGKFNF